MKIDYSLKPSDLSKGLERFWEASGKKIEAIAREYDPSKGSPVFTWAGKYTTRGWTEWTQGFQYGSAILQFDATGDESFLESGRNDTLNFMAPHVSHFGVHDHGFNNVSTYGNLLRLMNEGKTPENEWERNFYEMALKVSGAVQAKRWASIPEGGYLYSFNGPHSLFVDTIRTCRALMVSHLLGHSLMEDNDKSVNLFERVIQHGQATARYSIYYGEGRDSYDEWGRTAHEAIFNRNDGQFRCPNAQQGFSGFTTWTRGLSWAMVGYPEELELLREMPDSAFDNVGGRKAIEAEFLKAARATCDWFIANTAEDGICYWDGGAPNLHKLGDYRNRPADPFNDHEPVDSTASAIGAQGLLRLGRYLGLDTEDGKKYFQAGLTVLRTLLTEAYTSGDAKHHGLLLHSIYHQPNGWDYVPEGRKVACGESSMWGDYHIRELALYTQRIIRDEPDYRFYRCVRLG
ncbi:MAG: glycoside hydrolase family 88 protein [Opitutales bacterium]|nr:glycoside hydrolase family 88 protein [Opitutales bacterium]